MRPETASQEISREIHDFGTVRKTRYSYLVNHIRDRDGKASRIVELVETESLGTPGCE